MSDFDHRLIQFHDYAIINPLQVDSSIWGDLDAKAIVPSIFKNQPELFPVLVDLNAISFDRRISLIDQTATWRWKHDQPLLSALVKCSAKPERVTRHLAQTMHVRRDGKDRLFRFYDPRVFQHLVWLFDSTQMTALLGPMEVWTWRAADGDWESRSSSGAGQAALQISADQWPTLLRMEDINVVLATLADTQPSFAVDEKLVRRVDSLLVASRSWNMSADDDRHLFAVQAIRFHPNIHAHPLVRAKLELVQRGEQSYVGACADLDDEVMLRLMSESGSTCRDER